MTHPPFIPPAAAGDVQATVLICTFNRAGYLAGTLDSLAKLPRDPGFSWDVLIVDNNSTDETRRTIEDRQPLFPVPLRYLFEPRQGKSVALNSGLRTAAAQIIVFTDDDVAVAPGWIEAAVRPLLDDPELDYTGGPVRPIWGAPRPGWLNPAGNMGGPIAVKDHGSDPFVFEERNHTPLGVNMAVRRTLLERIGGFREDLGRKGKSLLGQEQAEFFYRSRAVGARGLYVPAMIVDHVVPAYRLTRRYYQRWWYWKGVSHARVHRMHGRTELGLDIRGGRRLFGVPRFVLGNIGRHAGGLARAVATGNAPARTERLLSLAYYLGYCLETWRGARNGAEPPAGGSTPAGELANRILPPT